MAKMVVNSDGSPRLWFICGIKQQWEEKGQIINISYALWFKVKKFGNFCYLNYILCDFFFGYGELMNGVIFFYIKQPKKQVSKQAKRGQTTLPRHHTHINRLGMCYCWFFLLL
jgi:hypothetical protein